VVTPERKKASTRQEAATKRALESRLLPSLEESVKRQSKKVKRVGKQSTARTPRRA